MRQHPTEMESRKSGRQALARAALSGDEDAERRIGFVPPHHSSDLNATRHRQRQETRARTLRVRAREAHSAIGEAHSLEIR